MFGLSEMAQGLSIEDEFISTLSCRPRDGDTGVFELVHYTLELLPLFILVAD